MLTAGDGTVTGLLGPNGAGKTTTLRMLYAVMKPDSGRIDIDGVDAVAAPQQAQARLGVLPDGYGLYPRLTAREHIHYYGELHGITGRRLRQRAQELLEMLDMTGARRSPHRRASRTASAPRSPSPEPSCTSRRTSCSTSRPTAST